VCKFGLATNRRWRDRDGETREEVCFVDCTVFAKSAEVFNQYMSKGRSVLVEGRLQFQQWTTPEGEKRSKHEVIVENFTFLGGRGGEVGGRGGGATAGGAPVSTGAADSGYDEPPPPTDDGIPF
jgi:single-strand DNA-binding protein